MSQADKHDMPFLAKCLSFQFVWLPYFSGHWVKHGMEWNGLDWNGLEWNGLEWNGILS